MPEKTVGYILLTLGILAILYTALDVTLVFTKRKEPIQLFNFEGISVDPAAFAPQIELPEGFTLPKKNTQPQKTQLISADIINDTSNIFAHLMLMGFIATIGGKIATIGTQLVRPIVVKLHQPKQP